MKKLLVFILALLLIKAFSVSSDPVQIVTLPRVSEVCGKLVCYTEPLSDYEQCLQDLERRGELDDYHKAFCDPRLIPPDRLKRVQPRSF